MQSACYSALREWVLSKCLLKLKYYSPKRRDLSSLTHQIWLPHRSLALRLPLPPCMPVCIKCDLCLYRCVHSPAPQSHPFSLSCSIPALQRNPEADWQKQTMILKRSLFSRFMLSVGCFSPLHLVLLCPSLSLSLAGRSSLVCKPWRAAHTRPKAEQKPVGWNRQLKARLSRSLHTLHTGFCTQPATGFN